MKKQIISVVLSVLVFAICLGSNVRAQSPDKIFKTAVKALGGEKAMRAIRSVQISGKISRLNDGLSGNFRSQAAQPNLYALSFDINGFETASGYNGKSGWARDSKNGLRTLTGEISRDFQAVSNYRINRWLNYKKDKSKLIYNGQTNIDGKIADAVSLTTAKGSSIKMYFDKVSGMLVREEIPVGEVKYTYDYADFRSIGGVQQPFTIFLNGDGDRYEIKVDSVVYNTPIAKSTFDFPKISDEPLPDIAVLLKEIQANEDKVENILENYTYTQTNAAREIGKDGNLRVKESETFQLTFYKGYRIRRLVAKNSKPLAADEQDKEDKNVEKRVADIEKEIAKKQARIAKQSADGTLDEENSRVSIAEVLRASNLVNPRRERFRGRDVIVFDFEPNPNFDFKNAKSFLKFFGKTSGVMWIDAEDKQVARLEAVLSDNYKIGGGFLANLKKGAAFTLENERVNNEIWLPSLADINLSVKVLLVKGINVNQLVKYSDYQKFNSEVKDSAVDKLKNQ